MYQIGSKWLLASRKEIKDFKNMVLNRPCNDEIKYQKRVNELKDVIRDQDHELYEQKQKISSLENQLKAKRTATVDNNNVANNKRTATIPGRYSYSIVNNYPTREEVSKQIKEELNNATEIRRLENLLAEAKVKYNNLTQSITTLKASYDNLLDENTALKRKSVMMNDSEKLNEAKLIIDALQKENASLKSQLSDHEAHKCHCDNSNNEEYTILQEKYDRILRDNVRLMVEKGKQERDKKDNEERYNIYRDRMDRVVNESLAKSRYFAGLADYLDNAMDLLSKIGVHTVTHTTSTDKTINKYFVSLYGTKYQTSMKLHQVTSKFVEEVKSLEKEVSAYRNADLEETMNEDEE